MPHTIIDRPGSTTFAPPDNPYAPPAGDEAKRAAAAMGPLNSTELQNVARGIEEQATRPERWIYGAITAERLRLTIAKIEDLEKQAKSHDKDVKNLHFVAHELMKRAKACENEKRSHVVTITADESQPGISPSVLSDLLVMIEADNSN